MVTRVNLSTSTAHPWYQYFCLSTDDKPMDARENSFLKELDTGDEYYFSDEEWNLSGGSVADGSIQLGTLRVTTNGRHNAPSGQAYRAVIVNVPNPSTGTLQVIANGVADVTNYASINVNVPDASLPDYVQLIERHASVSQLPTGLTQVGDYAFSNYGALALTTLPDSVTTIGSFAFRNCVNLALTALPFWLTTIGSQAFSGCTSLTSLSLPAHVDIIGTNAFANCTGLVSVTFSGSPSSIAANAFSGCTNLVDIYVPWSQNAVNNAPWGATNATIHYDWTGD